MENIKTECQTQNDLDEELHTKVDIKVSWRNCMRVNIDSYIRQVRTITHQPVPRLKKICQCLEFTQMMYYPQQLRFSTEDDLLIISCSIIM